MRKCMEDLNMKEKSLNQNCLQDFKSELILYEVNEYEKVFDEISLMITSYKGDGLYEKILKMIDFDFQIKEELNTIENRRLLSKEIKKLDSDNQIIHSHFKIILDELTSIWTDLKQLTKSSKTKNTSTTDNNQIRIKDIINYSMRLAKFTKIPSFKEVPIPLHPNNFIWPAEDALRRGVLALSTNNEKKIIMEIIRENGYDVKNFDLGMFDDKSKHLETQSNNMKPKVQSKVLTNEEIEDIYNFDFDISKTYNVLTEKYKINDNKTWDLDLDLYDPDINEMN